MQMQPDGNVSAVGKDEFHQVDNGVHGVQVAGPEDPGQSKVGNVLDVLHQVCEPIRKSTHHSCLYDSMVVTLVMYALPGQLDSLGQAHNPLDGDAIEVRCCRIMSCSYLCIILW